MSTADRLRRITQSPALNLGVGLILFASGLSETVRELTELAEWRLSAHHGVALLGLLTVLKALPDVFEGAEYFSRGEEEPEG